MQALLDEKDYDKITAEVLKRITKKFELVPKEKQKPVVNLEEFRKKLCHGKAPRWVILYIFNAYPETSEWAFNVNKGSGHHIKINFQKAKSWMDKNEAKIDWSKSLPN